MIAAPAVAFLRNACLYRESADANTIYVDLLEPAPMRGESAIRWMPIPNSDAYLVGEVRFGPGADGFGEIPELTPEQRAIPMPWEIAPVLAWCREGDGVRVIA